MVLVDGVKYACQQCITGHRSSKCTHSTRPLTEIRSPFLSPSLSNRRTRQLTLTRSNREGQAVDPVCALQRAPKD